MANSKVQYTADGSTQSFAVTFPFISRSHVDVKVDGVSSTFTWDSDSQITISSPTLSGSEVVLIIRTTSQATRLIDYVDGSNLSESDLDTDSKQAFFMAQESLDELTIIDDSTSGGTAGDILVADGTDFINKTMSGDATISSTGALTIANTSVETAMLANDAVTGAKIADDAIDSEHYTDGSIDSAHIGDDQIITSKILDGNVTLAKMASASVDSDNIVDDSIVNADINASAAIDASKIADGTVSNTEFQYLNSVTSNVQSQLDTIVSGTVSTIDDDNFTLQDNGDTTKKAQFQCSGISTSTTRTFTFPDADATLVGTATTDTLTNKTLTSPALNTPTINDPAYDVSVGNTANTNSSQGDNPISTYFYEIATCANAGDAVTLPTAAAGKVVVIANNGANKADVFPASGDNIDAAGVNTAYSLESGTNVMFIAQDATDWDTISGGSGSGNTTTEGLYEHSHTISANYVITTNNNALTAGPITIDTGISVTIPTGSTWVIA